VCTARCIAGDGVIGSAASSRHDGASHLAAVDVEVAAGAVAGLVAGKEQSRVGDLPRGAHATEHDVLGLELLPLLVGPFVCLTLRLGDGRLQRPNGRKTESTRGVSKWRKAQRDRETDRGSERRRDRGRERETDRHTQRERRETHTDKQTETEIESETEGERERERETDRQRATESAVTNMRARADAHKRIHTRVCGIE
jgi:hypothetical protein